jgi:glycogen debranching enzyme
MEGTTFCISDRRGDLPGGRSSGLFVRDTRMLSRWELSISGRAPAPLSVSFEAPFAAVFLSTFLSAFLSTVPAEGTGEQPELLVVRRRVVGNGMREDISVHNTGRRGITVDVMLAVQTDFADVFEVKDGRVARGPAEPAVIDGNNLDFAAESAYDGFGVTVVPDSDATAGHDGFRWRADVPGRGVWHTTVEVVPRVLGERLSLHHPRSVPIHHAEPYRRRQAWRRSVPQLETSDRSATEVLRRSVEDLATLRIFDPDRPELPVVAAGAPWFMALFGRDSLLTSLMLLPLDSSLATGTLETLAAHQGTRVDVATEEEPGRILHEIRFGPAGTLALGGRNAYFGTADATPLFVMLVGELVRWLGPGGIRPELVDGVDRALAWMRTYGDPDGDGFIEYLRKTERGLLNQGWKDSWDGVNFADGSLAEPPVALAEVQGYAYAAYLARASIAEALDDPGTAVVWRGRAEQLRTRFNREFWIPERGWFALGLDRNKRPIDALTSNIGHCLWTGIVDEDKAESTARHLVSPQLFSGWGIRTLGESMGAYDPLSYHNGSVWPHDTAICVGGLARYGFMTAAGTLAQGLLDASEHFGHRLPELFGGFSRSDVSVPVPYPAACSPQAWAAAAPVEILRALLRLGPDGDELRCDPVLPIRLRPLRLTNVVFRGRLHDIEVDPDGSWRIEGRPPD